MCPHVSACVCTSPLSMPFRKRQKCYANKSGRRGSERPRLTWKWKRSSTFRASHLRVLSAEQGAAPATAENSCASAFRRTLTESDGKIFKISHSIRLLSACCGNGASWLPPSHSIALATRSDKTPRAIHGISQKLLSDRGRDGVTHANCDSRLE